MATTITHRNKTTRFLVLRESVLNRGKVFRSTRGVPPFHSEVFLKGTLLRLVLWGKPDLASGDEYEIMVLETGTGGYGREINDRHPSWSEVLEACDPREPTLEELLEAYDTNAMEVLASLGVTDAQVAQAANVAQARSLEVGS